MAPSDSNHSSSVHKSISTTSLAKHFQSHHQSDLDEADISNNNDFCNGFWGLKDEGYDVLLARLRGASRTVDEVRGFWKERAAIEEDYSRKLLKLSKQPLGRDEIGSLRVALDTLRTETQSQAQAHQELTDAMRSDAEGPAVDFIQKLTSLKKNSQSTLERAYKLKKSQEGYVSKAREKYHQECLRINSYTAQTSLSQGRELDKVASKLENAQRNIGANERDFGNFVKTLTNTTRDWEGEWKAFCDQVQDLEEERTDFIKDIAWSYANAVSSVCVTDDEACERLRVVLEALEPHVESESFVRGYGTGSKIPDPPPFVSYAAGESDPLEPSYRIANFARNSTRAAPPQAQAPPQAVALPAALAPVEPELPSPPATPLPTVEAAPPPPPSQQQQRSFPPPQFEAPANVGSSSSSPAPSSITNGFQAQASAPPPQGFTPYPSMPPPPPPSQRQQHQQHQQHQQQPQRASSTDPFASRNPVMSPSSSSSPAPNGNYSGGGASMAEDDDPIGRALADLAAKRLSRGGSFRSARSGAVASPTTSNMGEGRFSTQPIQEQPSRSRRQSVVSNNSDIYSPPAGQSSSSNGGGGGGAFAPGHRQNPSLVPPMAGSTSAALAQSQADFDRRSRRSIDYSQAAESIVGQHPSSRPNSPAQARAPSPAFMQPPVQPPSPLPVEAVLSRYQQAFPGETSSHSRKNSTSSRMSRTSQAGNSAPPPHQGGDSARSPSPARAGFVGIGAGGRSPSPQPFSPPGRSPSPAPDGNQWQQPPPRQPSPAPYQQQQIPPRQPSPAPSSRSSHIPPRQPSPAPSQRQSIGLSLGPDGSVAHDEMAETYRRQQQQQQEQQRQQEQLRQQQLQQQQQQQYQPAQQAATSSRPPHPQQHQPTQAAVAPPPSALSYGGYNTAPPPQQGQYGYPTAAAPPPSQYQGYQQPPPPQQQQYPAYGAPQQQQGAYPPRQSSYGAPDLYGQQQQPIQRAVSPAPVRAPSPAPPVQPAPTEVEQFTEEGKPVIFYVKALYDYTATIDEEFDFQAGDIIAVTTCSDDGWWNGALLDESRRMPGKNVFPSNFVTMF